PCRRRWRPASAGGYLGPRGGAPPSAMSPPRSPPPTASRSARATARRTIFTPGGEEQRSFTLSRGRAAWMPEAKPAPPKLALYPCKQQGKNRPQPGLSCVYNGLIGIFRRQNRTITGKEQRIRRRHASAAATA